MLARSVGEQLRDAALEALTGHVHLHRPSEDAAVAAAAKTHIIPFINCTGPPNLNPKIYPAVTQRAAMRVLTNLTLGNVGCTSTCEARRVQLCCFGRDLAVTLTRLMPVLPLLPQVQ